MHDSVAYRSLYPVVGLIVQVTKLQLSNWKHLHTITYRDGCYHKPPCHIVCTAISCTRVLHPHARQRCLHPVVGLTVHVTYLQPPNWKYLHKITYRAGLYYKPPCHIVCTAISCTREVHLHARQRCLHPVVGLIVQVT